ncbi:Uncharacterised protein [Chlamydia trachomatis]|nr:Uncharacterised protein [Chlamydia trachomatis]
MASIFSVSAVGTFKLLTEVSWLDWECSFSESFTGLLRSLEGSQAEIRRIVEIKNGTKHNILQMESRIQSAALDTLISTHLPLQN